MNVEHIKAFVRAQPFESFYLVMANGERLLVPHEDFIWIMPNKRVVMVALPNGASRWVNLQLVAGLEKPASGRKTAGKKRKNNH
jgi:ABC-type sulfate/molybdate transport systems ATPase subunit